MGQEGAGEVAVAKRNDSNERRWYTMTTKDEEGQLSDVMWPSMTYSRGPMSILLSKSIFGGIFHRGQFTITGH